MEPTYQKGDLVIVRAKSSYEVGDIIAYLPDIGQDFPVIHRIVATEATDSYITQGDSRNEPDGWFATNSNIFGAAWLRIPGGGRVILLLREPHTWLAVALGSLGLGLITEGKKRLLTRSPRPPGHHRNRLRRRYAAAPVILLAILLILAAVRVNAESLTVDGGVLQAMSFEIPPTGIPDEGPIETDLDTTTTTAVDTTTTTAVDTTTTTAVDTTTTTAVDTTTTTAVDTTTSTLPVDP
jgi:hypothetical protein